MYAFAHNFMYDAETFVMTMIFVVVVIAWVIGYVQIVRK